MELHGIHHLTAITANARKNHTFYTQTLGLRLVKKTVNQDDISAYHLFYADGQATPGTDITFFDCPMVREQRGTYSIIRTGLRVAGEVALQWWEKRFHECHVQHGNIITRDGRMALDFEDPEGQRLSLVSDKTTSEMHPWNKSPVPVEHQICGLGPIALSVPKLERTDRVLREVMGMRLARQYKSDESPIVHVYEMGNGGPAAELHVAIEPDLPFARQGAGGAHHVVFRTTESEYSKWTDRLKQMGMTSSGPVNRFIFRASIFANRMASFSRLLPTSLASLSMNHSNLSAKTSLFLHS